MVVEKPYIQSNLLDSQFVRTFSTEINSDELVWHRDRKDRRVYIIEGTGWEFQLDNKLPIKLSPGDEIFIPKEVYHRIKKGTTALKIFIEEL